MKIKYVCQSSEIVNLLLKLAGQNFSNPQRIYNETGQLVFALEIIGSAVEYGPVYARSLVDLRSELVSFEKMVEALTTPIFQPIEVKLNDEYIAVVHKDKVVVGCQTFPAEVIEKVAQALEKAKKS